MSTTAPTVTDTPSVADLEQIVGDVAPVCGTSWCADSGAPRPASWWLRMSLRCGCHGETLICTPCRVRFLQWWQGMGMWPRPVQCEACGGILPTGLALLGWHRWVKL